MDKNKLVTNLIMFLVIPQMRESYIEYTSRMLQLGKYFNYNIKHVDILSTK